MTKWTQMISENRDIVFQFANNECSGECFQKAFAGTNNPARQLVRKHGTLYASRLARKAMGRSKDYA